jgi:Tol biopolymer transport system component
MNVIGQIQTSRGAWLAHRASIRLGALTIRPSSLEVAGPAETVTLEPRCMKVLVTLCDHHGGTVSRDAMIDQCWDGRIVSDAALNRSIAQVRKALALDPTLEIETIPRIGYRLKAPLEDATAAESSAPVAHAPRKRKWPLLAAAAVAVSAIALVSWLRLSRSEWRGDQVRPIVTDPGVESYPAISPNGDRVAYAKQFPDGRWHLFVKSIDGSPPRQLTTSAGSETWPSWREDGEALAFVRTAGPQCAIVLLDLITSNQTDLVACDPDHIGHPSFAGPQRLLYSDALPGTDQHAVYTLDLGDRTVRPVSAPPFGAHGDMDPIVSPDGQHAVFRRVQAWGVDFLMAADVTPRGLANVRALTDDGWKAHGVAWASDGRAVIYSSNRGGDWGLWLVGIGGGKPERISLGTTAITKIGGGPDGRLAVETLHARSDLRWLGADAGAVKSVMADVWTVSVGPKGELAYVSNESGSPELWTQTGDKPAQQTHLKSSYLHDTVWSPAGDGIAFIAVHDRAPQIFRLPLRSGVPVRLTDVPGDKANPAFLSDGRLIWLGRGPHGWQLVTMDAGGNTAPVAESSLGQDWTALKSGPGGVIGMRSGDPWLYRISADKGRVRADRTPVKRPDTPFAVAKDGIVVARGTSLVLVRWEGTQRELIRGDDDAQPPAELAVDPGTARILALDRSGNQSDLALITLSRR